MNKSFFMHSTSLAACLPLWANRIVPAVIFVMLQMPNLIMAETSCLGINLQSSREFNFINPDTRQEVLNDHEFWCKAFDGEEEDLKSRDEVFENYKKNTVLFLIGHRFCDVSSKSVNNIYWKKYKRIPSYPHEVRQFCQEYKWSDSDSTKKIQKLLMDVFCWHVNGIAKGEDPLFLVDIFISQKDENFEVNLLKEKSSSLCDKARIRDITIDRAYYELESIKNDLDKIFGRNVLAQIWNFILSFFAGTFSAIAWLVGTLISLAGLFLGYLKFFAKR